MAVLEEISQTGGTLGNVCQHQNGPHIGAANAAHQLQIHCQHGVMQTGNHQHGINQAIQAAHQPAQRGLETGFHHEGDGFTDFPADGSQHGMGQENGRKDGAQGNDNHLDGLGAVLFEETLQIDQRKAHQNSRDNLRLIADALNLEQAEIPIGDALGGAHGISVDQLGRYQRQAGDNAQNGGGAHFLGNAPHDAHRQHVQRRFTDDPQEIVNALTPGIHVAQAPGAAVKHLDVAQHAAEAQQQAAHDNGGNQRCENLRQIGDGSLQGVLVLFGSRFHVVLGGCGFKARNLCQFLVIGGNVVANDDLELSCLGKAALDSGQSLDFLDLRFVRIFQHQPKTGHAVCGRGDVFFSAQQLQQPGHFVCVLAHDEFSLLKYKFPNLFKQVFLVSL